jgi:hypothetical protein
MRSSNIEEDILNFERIQEAEAEVTANAVVAVADGMDDAVNLPEGRNPVDDVPTARTNVERFVAPDQYSEIDYTNLIR